MNIALFRQDEFTSPLPLHDERIRHVLRVLKKGPGDSFKAGVENGEIGQARIDALDSAGMSLAFIAEGQPEPLLPLDIILGFPRPIQANRILKDLTSLGIRRILLCGTELGEKSYTQGSFFSDAGWERAIREGASQAGTSLLPRVKTFHSLAKAIDSLADPDTDTALAIEPSTAAQGAASHSSASKNSASHRVALDPLQSTAAFGSLSFRTASGAILAIGSERGWTDRERDILRAGGFILASLGRRILRTETAATVALALCLAAMGEL